MTQSAKAANALYIVKIDSGIKSLIEKVEIDLKNSEIRFFFIKTVNRYGRRYFERNLARCFAQKSLKAPKITPVISKSRKDTTSDRFHQHIQLWAGLVCFRALHRDEPLWKDFESTPPKHERIAFSRDTEDLFDTILAKWQLHHSATPQNSN